MGGGSAMSERKVGSVTYKEVGEDYFKRAGCGATPDVVPLWALGVGAVISGEYYGWNFGLGTGGFGGLLVAAALMARHVLRPRLLDRGDVPGPAAHRRRVLVRALGDGPLGRVPHRPRREHGVRDHARRGRRRDGPADGSRSSSACSRSAATSPRPGTSSNIAWWNSLPFWWPVFYMIFVGINIIGIEATMRFTVTITVLSICRPGLLLHRGDLLGEARLRAVDEHPERAATYRRAEVVPGSPSGSAGSSRRSPSRSGSSSRSRRCRWRPRSRWIRAGTSREARSSRCTRC